MREGVVFEQMRISIVVVWLWEWVKEFVCGWVVEKYGNMIQGCDSAVIPNDHTLPSEDACIGRLRPYIYSFFSLWHAQITHIASLSFSFLSWKPHSYIYSQLHFTHYSIHLLFTHQNILIISQKLFQSNFQMLLFILF